jgi:hypothetical protein
MLRVRGLIAGLMMSIVAMYAGYCQTASLTANYDAFLQAYYEWEEDFKQVAPSFGKIPLPNHSLPFTTRPVSWQPLPCSGAIWNQDRGDASGGITTKNAM